MAERVNFDIKKFSMETLKKRCELDSRKSPMIVLLGKKDTGKSFLVRDILFHTKNAFPIGTAINATEIANEFYQHMMPSKFIHDKYSPQIVTNVVKRQLEAKGKRHQDIKARGGGGSNIDPRAFLILDDCLYDSSWILQESTRYVFMNGRHIDLTTMITMQAPLGIPPNLRSNIDFVFILRNNIIKDRKKIYENYAGMFPTFEMFCTFMDQCTEDYECLVIINGIQSNRLEDQVFWYKAEDHPEFRLCNETLWTNNTPFSSTMLNNDQFNPESIKRKSNNPWITVKKTTA